MLPLLLLACADGASDTDAKPDTEAPPIDSAGPDDTAPRETGDSGRPVDTDTAPVTDLDGDGHTSLADGGDDCDDSDPEVHPGARDVPENGKDDDCDGLRGPTVWHLYGPTGVEFGVPTAPGDVTGDGVADLTVSASYANDLAGAVYLFSGADLGPRTTSDDAIATFAGDPGFDGARTGESPSRALGDLDGDGVSELGYGALYADPVDTNTGSFYVWTGGALAGAYASADADAWYYDADGASESGFSAAGVGDVDEDGYPDLAVSAPRSGGWWNGRVWLVRGNATLGTDGATALMSVAAGALKGDQYSVLGWDVSPAIDLDDDGHLDLVASAYYGSEKRIYYGAIEVAYGPVHLGSQSDAADAAINGPSAYSFFGQRFDHGDLDGDGHTDLLVGAPQLDQAWILWGSGDRLAWADVTDLPAVDLYEGDGLGGGVAVADIDGDGDDDFALESTDGLGDGRIFLVPGGARVGRAGTAPSAVARWETGSDAADLHSGWLIAIPDLPAPDRPLFAAAGDDAAILLVQTD